MEFSLNKNGSEFDDVRIYFNEVKIFCSALALRSE